MLLSTKFGQLLGIFGSIEMAICRQNFILEEDTNCDTCLSVRETASHQTWSGGHVFSNV